MVSLAQTLIAPTLSAPTLSAPAPLRLQLRPFRLVNITLAGCGGTGSHIASGLISLAGALDQRGIHTDIQLIDPDVVEAKNVGRQLFSPGDIGRHKAEVLAYRLNAAFSARVGYSARSIDERDTFVADGAFNLVIGAVDNPAARAVIAAAVAKADGALWWADAGNENHSGQVCLGNTADAKHLQGAAALGLIDRLPAPHLVYPDLVRTPKAPKAKKSARAASCAELAAAGEQGLMVNRVVASYVLAALDALLVRQDLRWFALAFDTMWGGAKAYTIDVPTIAESVGMTPDELGPKPAKTASATRPQRTRPNGRIHNGRNGRQA